VKIQLGYVNENRKYQRVLDTKYKGIIVAVDRYVNSKATIKHGCLMCGEIFWARPGYLVNLYNSDHYCIKQNDNKKHYNTKNSKARINDEMKKTILTFHNQGFSAYQIAGQLGISRDTVRYHLKKMRGTN
jgi:transcriptional regulator with PAS, ATPase and Fis domain